MKKDEMIIMMKHIVMFKVQAEANGKTAMENAAAAKEKAEEAANKAENAGDQIAAEEAAKEAAKEADTRTAIQFLKEGFSVEQIARCIPALSIDEVRKLQEELLQTV